MSLVYRTCILLVFLSTVLSSCTRDAIEKDVNDLPLGVSANDFLSDVRYTSIQLEIVYVEGFAPTAEAVREVEGFLETFTNKPDGIMTSMRSIAPPLLGSYSIEEVREIEEKYRIHSSSGTNLACYVFFADEKNAAESSQENKIVLGKAYKNTSIVIFEKAIRDLAGSAGEAALSKIEHTTLRHEFGHLFGLVDNGSPAQSEHSDSTNHCDVAGCLMAATIAFGDIYKSNTTYLDLDPKCHQDLLANGGR